MDFPSVFFIQTVSYCNAQCMICPYDDTYATQEQGHMNKKVFESIVDEAAQFPQTVKRIMPYLMNEPLLDRELPEKIAYIHSRCPDVWLHIATNGILLDDELSERLLNSPLHSIRISMLAHRKETYARVMGRSDADEIMTRICTFVEKAIALKGEGNVSICFTNTPGYVTRDEIIEAKSFWENRGVLYEIYNNPLSRAGNVTVVKVPQHRHISGCKDVCEREAIQILFNGEVVLCCMDWRREIVLGNILTQSIYEIWNSTHYNDIRSIIAGKRQGSKNFLCYRCEEAITAEKDIDTGMNNFFRGIQHGERAYCGPRLLQLDITNNCNTNCVGCWCHSDYLGEKKLTVAQKKIHLPFEKIKEIVDDASDMDVEGIQLAGSGEPLLHPDITLIIDYIKSKGLALEIVTNGILLTEDICICMIDKGVEKLAVSIWAGTPETYVKVHPNQPPQTFHKIKHNLKFLRHIKKARHGLPTVRIYHVISTLNYHEIERMVEFCLEVGATFVEFQAIDIIKGKTEFLALQKKQIASVEKQIQRLKKRNDYLMVNTFDVEEFNEFGRFIIKERTSDPFYYYFDNTFFYHGKCPLKQGVLRVRENLQLNFFEYFFNKNVCQTCVRAEECEIDKKTYSRIVYFLSMVGTNTFLRRIKSVQAGGEVVYDLEVNEMPCYAGWDYCRILTDGNVIPCCKGGGKPLGNIYRTSLKTVWFSERYNEFRRHAKRLNKCIPYFKEIECIKGCDNLGRNAAIHRELYKAKVTGVLV